MEESQKILLNSVENCGVSIPKEVSSIRDLKPSTLVSICAQTLNLIEKTSLFPESLSDSMLERFKICADIASAIKDLGYVGDMSYSKLLYPSEEDLYKLVRFLVERLSELSESVKIAEIEHTDTRRTVKEENSKSTSEALTEKADGLGTNNQKVIAKPEYLRLKTEISRSSNYKSENASINIFDPLPLKVDQATVSDVSHSSTGDLSNSGLPGDVSEKNSAEAVGELRRGAIETEGTTAWSNDRNFPSFEQRPTVVREHSPEIKHENESIQNQEKVGWEEDEATASDLQQLEEELELLKAASEMVFDDQHSVDFYIEQLNKQIDARKRNIGKLESEWDAYSKHLEERKYILEESLYANIPEAKEKLQKLREIELEMESVSSEVRRREEEHDKLFSDLNKQPKVASRRSYIHRIQEITKNSRKQDADIERILKETRELQIESNSIQDRLHRTYAVLDEMVFREAKKDPVGRQAYRLLTSMHETFEQISDKTLGTDRVRRESAELEKKLAAMASRSLNVDKLQADLDAIIKENERLEHSPQRDH